MSTTALSDPRDGERAPSLVRDDDLFVPRLIGVIAAALVIFGATALMLIRSGRGSAVGPGWASIILTVGLIGLLFHAAFDRDIQFRPVYMVFGYLAIALGGFLYILPYPVRAGDQFGPGFLCQTLGLMFLLCFLRHETDVKMRDVAFYVLAGAGGIMALFGMFGGLLNPNLLLGTERAVSPIGVMVALLGLGFLVASIGIRGTADQIGYRIGLAIGGGGACVLLLALLASFAPSSMWFAKKHANYFMPYGAVLQALGVLYFSVSLLICSDNRFVVMTRRELATFFFSPIFYMLLLGFAIGHWFGFSQTLVQMLNKRLFAAGGVPEPIISYFVYGLAPVILFIIGIPVLTMRLMSEEWRSGTIEVLLTSPVEETTIVLSKFLAAFIMFLITWVPLLLLFVGLRINGNTPFDIRPLFSFGLALAITGAAGISVGVLFSSLTRNQITAGVLTFVFMLGWTMIHISRGLIASLTEEKSIWGDVFLHVSYLDLWLETLQGKLVPKFLLFPGSLTIFSLFVSVKVLESRKWK